MFRIGSQTANNQAGVALVMAGHLGACLGSAKRGGMLAARAN